MSGSSDSEFEAAVVAHAAGDLAGAEEGYRAAAERGSPEAAFQLGVMLDDQERYEEAATAYRKAVDAGDIDARLNLANLLADSLGRREEAESLYRDAIAAGDARAMFDFGTLLLREGRDDEARPLFETAIAQGESRGHRGLAWSSLYASDLSGAIREYEYAVDAGDEPIELRAALRERGAAI